MRLRLIVSYVPRYRSGHQWHFVPPVTGVHLAGLTPKSWEIDLVHEQVRKVPIVADVDVVAISFFSGFARRAYEVADAYRELGVKVILGGPHATFWPEEAMKHADAVVTGEAESVWETVLDDAEHDRLQPIYRGEAQPMVDLPTPRYDLLEKRFLVPRVIQATRGCPFSCSFCAVPSLQTGFRVRPVDDVVHDIATTPFRNWWQDKVAWFWDDNLLVKRRWAKDLLREMEGLNKWWLTQASIDIVKDRELLDAMQRSGCIGIFLGIESFDQASLKKVGKRQNRASQYRDAVKALHDRGICVMAGFISGFDDQTPETIVRVADQLQELEFDVPFLSILTPFRGTPLFDEQLAEGRILGDRGWDHYNGFNVAFEPAKMSPDQLLKAHRKLWRTAFSPGRVIQRVARAQRQLRPGAALLSATMNGFYGLKRLRGNEPRVAGPGPSVPMPDVQTAESPAARSGGKLIQLRAR